MFSALKKWWKWIVAVGIGILAIFLRRGEGQEKAISNEEQDIQDDLNLAEVANEQAKEHDDKAHEIKAEAEKETENASTSSILDRWRR